MQLLETWAECDAKNKEPRKMMPKKVKRRREEGEGWTEYYDYLFPDDAANTEEAKGLKILEAAQKWKLQQEKQ